MENKKSLLQSLPKVDEALDQLKNIYGDSVPLEIIKKSVRTCIDSERQKILQNYESCTTKSSEQWNSLFCSKIESLLKPNLQRVINGTGVVIHTNLGRSLLSEKSAHSLVEAAKCYTNLEFNLATGKRGSRYSLVEELICDLTGAQAALVVNNNAAAVLLVLNTLAHKKEAIVSRGQLVEIGGSFRIPDVMEKSGVSLVEVGATNRTHLYDYENAITENTAILLKVHSSNFRMLGFTSEVEAQDLVSLAKENNLLVMEDLGSGCLVDLSQYGLPKEPTVQEVVNQGVDVVTFSGDKLLGGPQAGIIVGKAEVIEKIKKNQLTRALRIDKFTLAALENTLRDYYDINKALQNIPTLNMLTQKKELIKKRANKVVRKLRQQKLKGCRVDLIETVSRVGGGAIPEYGLDSWALRLIPDGISLSKLEREFRSLRTPVIGRIDNDAFLMDFRTVKDSDTALLTEILITYFTIVQ